MGKPTGFMEFKRLTPESLPVEQRLNNYKEFVLHLDDEQAGQQGARCMDCGIPFCTSGCPVNNIIPDWNDLVYRQDWEKALKVLHSTNNFPDFTGRICPAPCEAACTLNINDDAVGIKSIEHAIVDKGWDQGWILPEPPEQKTGKKVAVVGSGPAGLACAQQLARAGHDVVVFEKNDRIGGLLRYGIPDFKFEKSHIDRRVEQMQQEGVTFRTRVFIGDDSNIEAANMADETLSAADLQAEYDAVVLAGGAEAPRDLPVDGRNLDGIHFAMEFLTQQNQANAGDTVEGAISAKDKHVVVIGGGDTGSDCVGTSNRQGAASVTQFELMPKPPVEEDKFLTWPQWPLKLRTSSSHEEGCQRDWAVCTSHFSGTDGQVKKLHAVRVSWENGKMSPVPGSEFEIQADLVLLAMGFVNPVQKVLDSFEIEKDARLNAQADTDRYQTSQAKVFAAGDMRRGQSLVVWAIREGRQCARSVDEFLMGRTDLPR